MKTVKLIIGLGIIALLIGNFYLRLSANNLRHKRTHSEEE